MLTVFIIKFAGDGLSVNRKTFYSLAEAEDEGEIPYRMLNPCDRKRSIFETIFLYQT